MSRVTLSFVASVRFVADVFGLLLTSRSLERSLRHRRTRAALAALVLAVLFAQMRGQAPLTDALPYAKGYLATGDYVVGGGDLIASNSIGGLSTGTISISGVPDNADVIGAFLYWEGIWTSRGALNGAMFRGKQLTNIDPVTGANRIAGVKETQAPLNPATASCLASGSGSGIHLSMFRADVLRFLPKQLDKNGKWTGTRLVNGNHTVTMPQTVNGNTTPSTAGSSLLIIYRDPTGMAPLRKVVV